MQTVAPSLTASENQLPIERFKSILWLYDHDAGGPPALERVVTVAKKHGAQLTVVEVLENLPRDLRRLVAVIRPILIEDPEEAVIRERRRQLEHALERIREQGVPGHIRVSIGTPLRELTREVVQCGHDLVMLTAASKSGFKERFLGTTSVHLLRECLCPVWVMKGTRRERCERILAVVEAHPDDEEQVKLAGRITAFAGFLARLEQSDLHVLSLRTTEQGPPAVSLIAQAVQEKQIELVIMSTSCSTGIPSLFARSTAEKVLQRLDCSLLAVPSDHVFPPIEV